MKDWKFPTLLGCAAISVEILVAFFFWHAAPPGWTWLGSGITNPHDTAVYLSYLQQGQAGQILLENSYAIEPQTPRFFAFWSILGLFARTGIPIIVLHEFARWLCTLILAFAVFRAACQFTNTDQDAKLTSLLAFLGVGTGWIYAAQFPPDIGFEFAIFPALLSGGAHIILSLALMLTGLSEASIAIRQRAQRSVWISAACFSLLMAIHPYFIPLIGIYLGANFLLTIKPFHLKQTAALALPFILAIIPALILFLPTFHDPLFYSVNVTANRLPLQPATLWLATLFPFIIALLWRFQKKISLTTKEQWIIVWIISAVICIFLPFPWTKRFTQGLGIALVFLTLPAWIAIRNRITASAWKYLGSIGLITIVGLSPIALVAADLRLPADASLRNEFYASSDQLAAWNWLNLHAQDCSILIDDPWTAIWTPAMTRCRVFLGHPIATPDTERKLAIWKRIFEGRADNSVFQTLHQSHVNFLLVTSPEMQSHMHATLPEKTWISVFRAGTVEIFKFDF